MDLVKISLSGTHFMLKKPVVVFALFAQIFFLSCAGTDVDSSRELTVSAAISLKNAFEEIGKSFESGNKDTKVLFNFSASGKLARQIEAGAPVDVFASASPVEMDRLESFLLPGSRVDFADNSIALIIPSGLGNKLLTFEELTANWIKRIAMGNPETVPAGRYAKEVLEHYKLFDLLKKKIVFAENVRQVLDYVARGEVEAGVVYMTDAKIRSAEVKEVAIASENTHKPVRYPIALIKTSEKKRLAQVFIAFVKSGKGKNILKKFGFQIPFPESAG